MMVHRIVVEDQSLRWYGRPPKIADNSIEFVQFQFHLPEEWASLLIVAQFTQSETYNMLMHDDRCFLPVELKAGICQVSLFGYSEGKPVRATSIPLVFQIEESGFVSSAETPIPPTPDLYTQLIEYFSSIAGSDGGVGGGSSVQSDWNAAEGEPGHVLNRTHWTEYDRAELLPECNPIYDEGEGIFRIMGAIPFVVGEEITVNWNGTPYKCLTYALPDENMGEFVVFGNSEVLTEMLGLAVEANDAPFIFLSVAIQSATAVLPLDGSTEVTVSILGNGETIHKLDNKYLDLDWLPVITHAKGEIVAERTGSANYFGTAWFGQATPYNVTPGKYYFVVWNGDEYRVQFEPGTDEHVYGSFSSDAFAITYAYDSSEVPSLRYGFRCRPLDGSTEVALSIYESVAVPNKIPDEFLPDGYASGGTVELDTTLTQEGKAADAKAVGDAISKLSGGNANYGAENAGKLLYVGADGFATVLALGAGLAIENGVLILTGNSQGILVNDDGEGNVTVSNLAVTDDGNGNVTVTGVTVTDDGNGNVSVA